jgi:demethylmenaquinone methyltransferase/2-methoxy-6-polyprenyl-1,4-benzoquinol methylase
MISQAEFFDSYADRWDSMEREDICDLLDRVVKESEVSPGMDILDVGTGTGVLIPCLLKSMNDSGKINAIDISQGMLRVAESKGFPANVRFEHADIETYDCPDCSYDRVMCNGVYPHFEDKNSVLLRIYRMLKPGGFVVISHPTGREAVNRTHSEAGSVVTEDRVPDAAKMQQMLETAGFSDVQVIDEPEFYLAIGRRS